MTEPSLNLHANAVVLAEKGCLILGAAGSGKSSLSLALMGLGAELIADDRCKVERHVDRLLVSAPETLPPAIEARGVGLLKAHLAPRAELAVIIQLDEIEIDRLPKPHMKELLGINLPCLHNPDTAHFPFAIRHYLLHGFANI